MNQVTGTHIYMPNREPRIGLSLHQDIALVIVDVHVIIVVAVIAASIAKVIAQIIKRLKINDNDALIDFFKRYSLHSGHCKF